MDIFNLFFKWHEWGYIQLRKIPPHFAFFQKIYFFMDTVLDFRIIFYEKKVLNCLL